MLTTVTKHLVNRPALTALCLIACAFTTVGCSDGRLERIPVVGTVSYNGQPVAQGTIRFVPLKGQQIPISATPIKDGKYKAESKGGIAVGEYCVEIEAFYKKQTNPNMPLPPGVDPDSTGWVQYMPDKYGKKSELTFKVESGVGSMTKDFDLPL